MWRIMHVLFGFHYVLFPWGFGEQEVLRVKGIKSTGEKYVSLFGSWHFLNEDGTTDTGRRYRPLTWEIALEDTP